MTAKHQAQTLTMNQTERAAFAALKVAIQDAWDDTRRQIEEADYDPQIVQTAFGQFLFHNVLNRVVQLDATIPCVVAKLVPNERRSAHYILVIINGRAITISAVPDLQARPRDARFRSSYARMQGRWIINEHNDLEPSPPLGPDDSFTSTYIHLLHGPRVGRRRQLGFIQVAIPNIFGEYDIDPIPIDAFLDAEWGAVTSDEETIEDTITLELETTRLDNAHS